MSVKSCDLTDSELQHFLCQRCSCYLNVSPVLLIKEKLICGRCPGWFGDAVEVPMIETMLKNILFPCQYKKNGCSYMIDWENVEKHELSCKYREVQCFLEECTWKGILRKFHVHVNRMHSEKIISPDQIIAVSANDTSYHELAYVDGDRVFPVFIKMKATTLCHSVRGFSPEPKLENYQYNLVIQQSDSILTYSNLSLELLDEQLFTANKPISTTILNTVFEEKKPLHLSISVIIKNTPPPPASVSALAETFKCDHCSIRYFPFDEIYIGSSNRIFCKKCIWKPITRNEPLEEFLKELYTRPLILNSIIPNSSCSKCANPLNVDSYIHISENGLHCQHC